MADTNAAPDSNVSPVPAGWYVDPSGLPQQRWWDGHLWTHDVTPMKQDLSTLPAPKFGTYSQPQAIPERRAPEPQPVRALPATTSQPDAFPTRRQLRRQFEEAEAARLAAEAAAAPHPEAPFALPSADVAADVAEPAEVAEPEIVEPETEAVAPETVAPESEAVAPEIVEPDPEPELDLAQPEMAAPEALAPEPITPEPAAPVPSVYAGLFTPSTSIGDNTEPMTEPMTESEAAAAAVANLMTARLPADRFPPADFSQFMPGAAEKAAAEREAAEKAAQEQAAADRAAVDKAAADRAEAERAAERSAAEATATAERQAAERAADDRAQAERSAEEAAAAERAAAEHAAAQRTAAVQRIAAEREALANAAAAREASENAAAAPFSPVSAARAQGVDPAATATPNAPVEAVQAPSNAAPTSNDTANGAPAQNPSVATTPAVATPAPAASWPFQTAGAQQNRITPAPAAIDPVGGIQYQPFGMVPKTTLGAAAAPDKSQTVSIWAIAIMPLIVAGAAVLVVTQLADYYTRFMQGGLLFIFVIATIALAVRDSRELRTAGHQKRASPAWVLLTPLGYLIARSVHVHKETGRGSAPLWTWLVAVGAVAAGAVLLPDWLEKIVSVTSLF